jgi:hypothetical protein
MNTTLDPIHDTNIEGHRGECLTILASFPFTDEWPSTNLCLDIKHVVGRAVVPRYIMFVVNAEGIGSVMILLGGETHKNTLAMLSSWPCLWR